MRQILLELLKVDVPNDTIGEIGRHSEQMVGLAERFERLVALLARVGPDLGLGDARDCRWRRGSTSVKSEEKTEDRRKLTVIAAENLDDRVVSRFERDPRILARSPDIAYHIARTNTSASPPQLLGARSDKTHRAAS